MTAEQVVRRIKFGLWGLVSLSLFSIFILNLPAFGALLGFATLILMSLLKQDAVQRWLAKTLVYNFKAQQTVAPHQQSGYSEPKKVEPLSQDKIDALLDEEARPAIMLKRIWPTDAPGDQNSWLGGLPRLPDGIEWPVNPDSGMALHHLAQIDLSEMPPISALHQLPNTGMLWFFADIDAYLDWPVGPDMAQARVIYHPHSTAAQNIRVAPENLPEVNHEPDSFERVPIFRHAPFRVYARWPVTGHKVLTWDEETLPDGATWNSGYPEALHDRMEAERAQVLGPVPERISLMPGPTRLEKEEDGQSRTIYDPMRAGKMFPYHNAMAAEIVKEMQDRVLHQKHSDQQQMKLYPIRQKDIEKTFESLDRSKSKMADYEERLAQHRKYADMVETSYLRQKSFVDDSATILTRLKDLYRALMSENQTQPLEPSLQEAFDRVFQDYCVNNPSVINGEKVVSRGRVRILQRSIDEPALTAALPEEYFTGMVSNFSSFSSYSKHYLLGAKGVSSNPTAGKDVRLAQFDTDYGMDFMFCDCGIIDFWIDPDDLADGRWDRAWAATAGG